MGLEPLALVFFFFIFGMSVILHEVAHGYVAYLCGDPTADLKGRLTLNPIPHIDPMMTIIVPLFFFLSNSGMIFGAAKPVPVNPALLRKWPRDYILVSIAGVAVNFALAGLLALLIHLVQMPEKPLLSGQTLRALRMGALMNIVLGVFNLIPIPPLDGSRAFRFLLPRKTRVSYDRLEPFGFIILVVLLMSGALHSVIWPIIMKLARWMTIL
ncbi:MAG: site-2 protease family protein [Planctomycetota bacterium]|nr:site-2 protease family protein [Planctomycetota bacterium]